MGSGIPRKPRPGWMRWLWFAMATIGSLTTPSAMISAIHEGKADHRMIAIMILAFAIRLGMIGLFYDLWWKSRPLKID